MMNITPNEFNSVCQKLMAFGIKNHERIQFDQTNHLQTCAKANWLSRVVSYIKRLFCCDIHPAERVARRLITYLETNRKLIQMEHLPAVAKLFQIKNVFPHTSQRIQTLFAEVSSLKKFSENRKALDEASLTIEKLKEQSAADSKLAKEMLLKAQLEAKQVKEAAEACAKAVFQDAEKEAKEKRYKDKIPTSLGEAVLHRAAIPSSLQNWGHLLQKPKTMDTTLICSDGMVQAHWGFLCGFPYFESKSRFQTTANELGQKLPSQIGDAKETAAKDNLLPTQSLSLDEPERNPYHREIEFKEFSVATTDLMIKYIYTGDLAPETPIATLFELYHVFSFIGNETFLKSCEEKISKILNENPLLCFDLLLDFPKSHPALHLLIINICCHSQWNNWSEVPEEKKKKLVQWILEFEKPDFKNHKNLEEAVIPLLAHCYMGKFGTVSDPKKAFSLLEEQAKQNDPPPRTLAYLGVCHLEGIGTIKNNMEARANLIRAAKSHIVGRFWMFKWTLYGECGFKQSFEQAEKSAGRNEASKYAPFFLEMANFGIIDPQRRLGSGRIISCYESAIALGCLEALTRLGTYYLRSRDFDNEPEKRALGIQKLTEAAARGEKEAQFNLGEAYFFGQGVARDLMQSKIWYQRSADQGYNLAKDALNMRFFN